MVRGMVDKKELTPEEKEKAREVALKLLKDGKLNDLGLAYHIESSGAYGEAGSSAYEQFKYIEALSNPSDSVSGLMVDGLLGSRQDGKRYTGTLNEHDLIKRAAASNQDAFKYLKVQDVLELVGSKNSALEKYKDMYVSELDEKTYKIVYGIYVQKSMDHGVSQALGERAKHAVGGLEEILCKEAPSE